MFDKRTGAVVGGAKDNKKEKSKIEKIFDKWKIPGMLAIAAGAFVTNMLAGSRAALIFVIAALMLFCITIASINLYSFVKAGKTEKEKNKRIGIVIIVAAGLFGLYMLLHYVVFPALHINVFGVKELYHFSENGFKME